MWTVADGVTAVSASGVVEGFSTHNALSDIYVEAVRSRTIDLTAALNGLRGGVRDGIFMDIWNFARSNSLKCKSQVGQSLGLRPGQKYLYNGLVYTAW